LSFSYSAYREKRKETERTKSSGSYETLQGKEGKNKGRNKKGEVDQGGKVFFKCLLDLHRNCFVVYLN
jgi:hypothetical protein